MKKSLFSLLLLSASFILVGCQGGPSSSSSSSSSSTSSSSSSSSTSSSSSSSSSSTTTPEKEYITIAEAKIIAAKYTGEASTERYKIKGTIKTISNPTFGEMTIEDDTGEILVYGTYSADGALRYSEMEEKPYAGDEVTLYGTLQYFNSATYQIKSGWITSFTVKDPAVDPADYKVSTVAAARSVSKGSKLNLTGVVARITYANGKIPSGFYLVDATGSIYVYDSQIAPRVAIGNTVNILAKKDLWILETEQSNAAKYGYKGCIQVTEATLVSKDNLKTDFDKSWIKEKTVKEIINTPVTTNITTDIFKVNALVSKVIGQGFTNYYINDLDGKTGTYTYTQCSGADFDWLDEFDGKICTVYLSVINAKSTAAGCNWRFLPVEVIDENYTFDLSTTPEYVMEYHVIDQFRAKYTGDPVLEVVTKVSSDLLHFENATIAYSSSNTELVKFVEEDGKLVMHTQGNGTVTVTATVSYPNATPKITTLDIRVLDPQTIPTITVKTAINSALDTEVTIRGIAGPSLVNQTGFYLIDETGAIAVLTSKDTLREISLGNEVIMRGKRALKLKEGTSSLGQANIVDAELDANLYGKKDYSSAGFISGKTLDEIIELGKTQEITSNVYTVQGNVKKEVSKFATTYFVVTENAELLLYSASGAQYSWLDPYMELDAPFTLEIALCDWNSKGNKGAVLSVIDPTTNLKIVNSLNYGQ